MDSDGLDIKPPFCGNGKDNQFVRHLIFKNFPWLFLPALTDWRD